MSHRKNKTIWLVNKYAMPPQYESRLRTIKFAHYLTEAGYNVIVFGSSAMHNMNINLINDNSLFIRRKYEDIDFVHIRTKNYSKTSYIKRALGDFFFHYNLRRITNHFSRPDVIVATTSPLLTNPLLRYAIKNNITYYSESLDVWPDDFVNFGLISAKSPLTYLLFMQTKWNYFHSDKLIFSWEGCYKYLEEKKWDTKHGGKIDLKNVYYINNGVDLVDFSSFEKQYKLEDNDLSNVNQKNIIYLGSIRLANNVIQLIKAAEALRGYKDVKFLIYGDGDDRSSIINYCEDNNITNVVFKDKWIDPKYVPYVLTHSYMNIMNYISSEFARYGISSSKMFQYMASGKPIVCNIDILFCPITANKIGVAKSFKNSTEYANAIESILNLSPEDYQLMCNRSLMAAKEFDYVYLTDKFIQVLEN